MYTTTQSAPNAQGVTQAAIALQASGMGVSGRAQSSSMLDTSTLSTPWILLLAIGAYLLWSAIHSHNRVRESIVPSNIAGNLHNWVIGGLIATTFIIAMKVGWTKLTAWGFPGAGAIAKFFAAA